MTYRLSRCIALLTIFGVVAPLACAEDAKPSAYAPAVELEGQIDSYLERMADDLESPDDFNDELALAITQNATTIEVMSLVLAMHDSDSKYKGPAPSMMKAARALADDCDTHKAATTNLENLVKATKSAPTTAPDKWRSVGDIDLLMRQVPIIFNSMKRSVEGRRFSRSADKNAQYAAALAAIAQTTQFDDLYASDDEDQAEWAAITKQMRDSAGAIVKASRADDQEAALKALETMEKSCVKCHETFR